MKIRSKRMSLVKQDKLIVAHLHKNMGLNSLTLAKRNGVFDYNCVKGDGRNVHLKKVVNGMVKTFRGKRVV